MVKILDKLRKEAGTFPGLAIDIVGGLTGLFLPSDGRSAISYFSEGNWEAGYHSAAWNYVGVNTYGGNNTLRDMFRRATGTKVVFLAKIFKSIISEGL